MAALAGDWRDDVYKDYFAPIIRRDGDGRRSDLASFGMVPRERIPQGVKVFDTMSARAETVGEAQLQRRLEETAALPDSGACILRAELRDGEVGALGYRYGRRRAVSACGAMAGMGGRGPFASVVHDADAERG